MKRLSIALVVLFLVAACATSPLGRKQLKLLPEEQLVQMGVTAFQQMKQEVPLAREPALERYVQCVASHVAEGIQSQAPREWDVAVFRSEEANAFALPGGKVGVYTGLLEVSRNQHQLAAVIGHEMAHVVAGHSNERVSAQYVTETGMQLIQAFADTSSPMRQQLFGLLGVGAQVGILLPYSRAHETEADRLGLDIMARAGFDPREAVEFWRRMEAQAGEAPPELLSTHPSGGTRIDNLQARMERALKLYREARARGRTPDCG